ncbi:MAG: hypothetical protein RLZZ241_2192 [Bacteroidota bacterium]|jgi:glycine/D-amino acid oxidase-like deaminating enzyme
MLDFLIVGSGLAGLAVTETLLEKGHSLRVIDNGKLRASRVAGGLYNPVVLKRFTLSWEAPLMMQTSLSFYKLLEEKWGIKCDLQQPVFRRFASVAEQNAWFQAADRNGLSQYLEPNVYSNTNPALIAPYGFGKVLETGRITTGTLLTAFHESLSKAGILDSTTFNYNALELLPNGLRYKNHLYRRVVFCEGFGMRENPFFNYLPLQGTKGELLTIRAPELKELRIIKSGVFFIPLGNDRYRVGATYAWDDYSQEPTALAREHLLEQLRQFVSCDFEVETQVAGIRPTVPDRRPLVGQHPHYSQLYLLNGLGSRGVLIGPYAAQHLAALILEGKPLPAQMDISRFAKYLSNSESR